MGPVTKAAIAIYMVFALYSGFAVVSVAHNNSQVFGTTVHFSAGIQNVTVSFDTVHYPDGSVSYENFTVSADIIMDGRGDPLDVRVYDISYSINIMTIEDGKPGMKAVGSFSFYSMSDPVMVKGGELLRYHTTVNITNDYYEAVLNSSYSGGLSYWIVTGGLNYQISGFEKLPKNSLALWRDYSDGEVA